MNKKEELWRENKMKKNIIVVLIMIVSAIMSGCSTEEGSAGAKAYNWAKETVFGDDKTSTEIVSEDKPVDSEGVDERYNIHHVGDTIYLGNTDNEKEYSIEVTDVYMSTNKIDENVLVVEMTATNTGSGTVYVDNGTIYGDDFELDPSAYNISNSDLSAITNIFADLPPSRKAKLFNIVICSNPDQYKKLELQLGTNVIVDLKPALVVESNEFSSDPDTYVEENAKNNDAYISVDDDPLMYSSAGYEIYYPNADDGYVNIRSGPGTEYPVIGTMQNGENQFDRSNRMYEDSKWIEVEVYGEDGILHGYVAKSQVKKYEPAE